MEPTGMTPAPLGPNGTGVFRHRVRTPEDRRFIETFAPEDLRPADTIYDCIRDTAQRVPQKAALVRLEAPRLEAPHESTTYGELLQKMTQMANDFSVESTGLDPVVAIMLPMVNDGLIALWAAQTVGIAVPINPYTEYSALVNLLNSSRTTVLVASEEVLGQRGIQDVEALRQDVPTLQSVRLIDGGTGELDLHSSLIRQSGTNLRFVRDTNPLRDSMYMPTGGTTGQPKLVRMNQAGQLAVAWNVGSLMGPDEDCVVGHGMPNFHCGGTIALGLKTILYGQTLLTLSSSGFRDKWVIDNFWDIARTWRMTSVLATPTTYQALIQRDGDPRGSHVVDVHCGGSIVPEELIRTFHDKFGLWLRDNWGMTELHGTITGHYNNGEKPELGSAGRTLPHAPVKVLQLDGNTYIRECKPGEVGVLAIGGATLCPGYLDPSIDQEFFIQAMPDGQQWGNTGDLGYIAGGHIFVSGRSKDLIIRGGHNIDPREIEEALSSHPAVHMAAAVGLPDALKGELPVAFVQLKEGQTVPEKELLDHCRTLVQERAALPVEITIVDEIPQTPVGKISKPSLRQATLEKAIHRIIRKHLGTEVSSTPSLSTARKSDSVTITVPESDQQDLSEGIRCIRSELAAIQVLLQVTTSPNPVQLIH